MSRPASFHHEYHRQQLPERQNQGHTDFSNQVIDMTINEKGFVTRALGEPFRLSFFDVTCLLVNRTIGTGIFNGPRAVMKGVGSPGLAILLWFCGCIYGLSGVHVFLEYGLNVPRYVIDGVEQSVPRSGGELHYLQYVFPRPRYRKGTVLLSGVLFGISFICVGNMASNCIDCALRLMQIAHPDKDERDWNNAAIRGIAILIATVTCFVHAFSRRGGILLNNAFAIVKVLTLVFIIIATWVVAGGASGTRGLPDASVSRPIDSPSVGDESSGPSQAFLSVIFSFFGFNQPSYVMGEMRHPRRDLPRCMWWGMGIVSALYIAVNICYMIIVPANVQMAGNVAQEFFIRVFDSSIHGKRTVNAFLAISSFGNVVVWTYTAARMKQEIAKQGFIPFAKFFAKNKDVSLGKLLMWLERSGWRFASRKLQFLNPANHREKTPVGALLLHCISCVVLIIATYRISISKAYDILFRVYTYIIAAWFGFFLALGILILHFRGPPVTEAVQTPDHNIVPNQLDKGKTWDDMIKGTVNPKLGVVCATMYLLGSLYPIVMNWVPTTDASISPSDSWYIVPLISWCVLAASAVWFCAFVAIAMYRSHSGRKEFVYVCDVEFEQVDVPQQGSLLGEEATARRGGLILSHETIYMAWQAKETRDFHDRNAEATGSSTFTAYQASHHDRRLGAPSAEFDNTDFAST